MNYTITKLDKRHSWRTDFAYMIEFKRPSGWWPRSSSGVLDFDRGRRWFNATFGWSQDVETRGDIASALVNQMVEAAPSSELNHAWAYSCRYNEYRIYVRSEPELNWFVLSHPTDHT